jgi:hypothetical protein
MQFSLLGWQVTVDRPVTSLTLPPLARTAGVQMNSHVGTRDQVQSLFRSQKIPGDLRSTQLVVSGRDMLTFTATAADEVVRQAIARRTPQLRFTAFLPAWQGWLLDAARRHGVQDPDTFISHVEAIDLPAKNEWIKTA